MRKADAFTLLVASSIAVTAAAGCNCSGKDADQAAPVVEPSPASLAQPDVKKEKKEDPIIPSATDRKMALQLGYQLMAQGKIEEAEAKFKIAAAGGSPEAETMLMKIRMEKDAKRQMDSAKQKIEFGDYDGAILELGRIPKDSVQKANADKLKAKIESQMAARKQKMEEELRKSMEKAFAPADEDEAADQGEEKAAPAEEAAPAAEPPADSPDKAAPQEEAAPAADAPTAEEPAAEPAAE